VIGGVPWHDGGVLLGLAGLAFAVVFAVAISPMAGIETVLLAILAIAGRIAFVRLKPHAEARRARLKAERGKL